MTLPTSPDAPITLYLPHAERGAYPWKVLQDQHRVGLFASEEEALKFALRLAESIHQRHGVTVRMRFENAAGGWETVVAHQAKDDIGA